MSTQPRHHPAAATPPALRLLERPRRLPPAAPVPRASWQERLERWAARLWSPR